MPLDLGGHFEAARNYVKPKSDEGKINMVLNDVTLDDDRQFVPPSTEDVKISWMVTTCIVMLFISGFCLSCFNIFCVRRHRGVVIFGNSSLLLRYDQVMKLPDVEYKGGGTCASSENTKQLILSDENINSKSSSEHFGATSCSICLEDYVEGEKIKCLPCKHCFHSECIVPWLTKRQSTCPLCNFDLLHKLRDDDSEEEDDRRTLDGSDQSMLHPDDVLLDNSSENSLSFFSGCDWSWLPLYLRGNDNGTGALDRIDPMRRQLLEEGGRSSLGILPI
eukprot:CAMPEP_0195525776 /NCGR_PEP_ID=MMETSP0794_2-20130614/26391_1 /TAXON_ID=515487 /ORGANISM="Stephanopyxis turris, Strain CCMP 815" /LENGTH=276 /DNA_ID=CAMNT_0040656307 /DNA_START=214 /DNA_END=1044 /DNA_ORIENTATION=-